MRQGLPAMLDGGALSNFGSHVKGDASTYEDSINALLPWFTSDYQKERLLQEWQGTRFTAWCRMNLD